jgi:23S rRNA (cytidine1920-2'-O)/16S rRNA (cytidine1409-2'-O)-methyltransferase
VELKGDAVALIKPQFEAGRVDVSRGDGVIRDPEIHRQVLGDILTFAQNEGFGIRGLTRSPIRGPKGNVEFLAWLGAGFPPAEDEQVSTWIEAVLPPKEE